MNVVVLLGSRWSELERHHTRWRAVVERWRLDDRVDGLAVVDYPDFGRRAAFRPAAVLPSWLDGVVSLRLAIDGRTWWLASRRLRRALPWSPDAVVAATPLWAPLATAFDAVDDWRAFAPVAHLRKHVDAGYRAAAKLDAVTTPSAALAATLARDFGVHATVVPNGVDVARFSTPGAPAPPGLPDGRFAVYVGVVEGRVDTDLLAALVAAGVTVVVAGPGSERVVGGLGAIPPAQVAGLLQRAAVGLVPHRVDALTASMDPLKTLEYLAAGLPVAEGRGPAPDPAVADRDWSVVADRLLTLLTETP